MSEETTYRPYASLHNHTYFSIMDSLISPDDLFRRSKELGHTAVAVTDHGTLAGMWDCLKASKKHGIKMIAGCEVYFVDDVKDLEARFKHLILLAKNETGYKNLLLANKEGFDNKVVTFKKVYPRIDWEILEKHKEGLICTSACSSGVISQLINGKKFDEAKEAAKKLKHIFKEDFVIEIQAHNLRRNENLYSYEIDQRLTNDKLIEIAQELDIKVIVTTDSHYVNKEDYEAHDVWLAMSSGQPKVSGARLTYSVNDFYIKSGDDVFKKLSRAYKDEFAEQVFKNTLEIAEKCEQPVWIDPKFSNPSGKELPDFPVKDQEDYQEFLNWLENSEYKEECKDLQEDYAYLRYWCYRELDKLGFDKEEKAKRIEILKEEFDVMEFHGFSSYMLIVADLIDFARKNDIRVSAGRGSIGGSLIGYLTKIHKVDPQKFDLIFARFHNMDKKDYPDIDMDFAPSGRDKIIEYTKQKYGHEYVARIGNFINLTPRPYAKAISRTFLYGGDRKEAVEIGARISESIPSPTYSGIKDINKALEKAPLFAEYAERYAELKKFGSLTQKPVALATHAAGFVIGKRPLPGLVPLRRDADGDLIVEYEKERSEENGLVKMDYLGLETLDIINKTRELIKLNGKTPPSEPFDYHQYDKKTYDLISEGNTFCVFQLGDGAGAIDLCKKVKPKSIEDIATINALIRPSAKEIRIPYVEAKHSGKEVELLHPSLARAFKPTHGFGLYEECLMFLAKDVCGWSMLSADRLRKMTKQKGKYPDKDKKLRKDFIEDAVKNGVEDKIATKIWDTIVGKFGSYAFNKAHAVAYSFTGFETAYYKAHFPLEFLVANLMSEVTKGSKKSQAKAAMIKEEIRKLNVKIVPPNINTSEFAYKIVNDEKIMTSLNSIKYLGNAADEIIIQRPFSSFEDFLRRCRGRAVTAKAVQALAASGSLDDFGLTRRQIYLYASDYKKKLAVHLKKKNSEEQFNYPWPETPEWSISEINAVERFFLGEGLTGSKIEVYNGFFTPSAPNFAKFPDKYPQAPKEEINHDKSRYRIIDIQGELKSIHEFTVKKEDSKLKGQLMARLTLEDPFGNQLDMVCFPDGLEFFKARMKDLDKRCEFEPGIGVKVVGLISWYGDDISIIFEDLINCCPPPQLPVDFKEKKAVVMKRAKKRTKKEEVDPNILLEEIEDELAEEGIMEED